MNANFQINSIEKFDLLADSIDEKKIPSPKEEWINNPFKALYLTCKELLSKICKLYQTTLPKSLGGLSLGSYIMACKTNKPSKFLQIIMDDLHFKVTSTTQSVSLFYHWQKQIEEITKKLENVQPNIKRDGMQEAIWEQVNSHHKMPSYFWMVDRLAQRFNLSYDEVYKMKMQDIIIALTVDCVNQEYESRITDYQMQKAKHRK